MSDFGLKGLKVLMAGASKGIGRYAAELFAAEGADLAICARDPADLESAAQALRAKGRTVLTDTLDLCDAEAYKAWVNRSAEALGGCDVFISFASAGGGAPAEETWARNFEVDVMGTWRGVDAALPWLEKSENAAIVIVGTNVTAEPHFGPQPYAAMKAAITHYAGALSQQVSPKGIRVNTVSPGPIFIDGGDWDKIREGRRAVYDATVAKVPMGRLGKPEEVAFAIGFLASPKASFITGTNVFVDGGMTKRIQS
jgi:3-oxoacyl-[acyl-carrier protein] reductase